jgi:hypothetical protein
MLQCKRTLNAHTRGFGMCQLYQRQAYSIDSCRSRSRATSAAGTVSGAARAAAVCVSAAGCTARAHAAQLPALSRALVKGSFARVGTAAQDAATAAAKVQPCVRELVRHGRSQAVKDLQHIDRALHAAVSSGTSSAKDLIAALRHPRHSFSDRMLGKSSSTRCERSCLLIWDSTCVII